MPDPDRPRVPSAPSEHPDDDDLERAREIYHQVSAQNPDPVTRREAVEGELEDEGLSEEGEELGDHIE